MGGREREVEVGNRKSEMGSGKWELGRRKSEVCSRRWVGGRG